MKCCCCRFCCCYCCCCLVKIGSRTAEILRWWWCKVIFMSNPTFELSRGWVWVVTIGFQIKFSQNRFDTQNIPMNIRFHETYSNHLFSPGKQGLRRTWKLLRCTNWMVNLWICKVARASNKENWSIQLIH